MGQLSYFLYLIFRKGFTTLSFPALAELHLVQNKGTEVMEFFREHCHTISGAILQASTISDVYDLIGRYNDSSNGKYAIPLVVIKRTL